MKKMLNGLNTLPGNAIVPVLFVLGFGGFVLIGTVLPWLRRTRRQAQEPGFWQEVTDVQLPAVRPAWMFDNSDTSPECPECYIEHLRFSVLPRNEDGGYVMPAGDPVICTRHAATTLAKALREKETTR